MQPSPPPKHQNKRMDERVILKMVREGSREALGMLWSEHSSKVLNLAFRMLRDRDEAEDILMDVFVGIISCRSTYNAIFVKHHFCHSFFWLEQGFPFCFIFRNRAQMTFYINSVPLLQCRLLF